MKLWQTIVFLLASTSPTALFAQPVQPESNASASEAQTAWIQYRDTLTQYRKQFLGTDLARDPKIRSQALYYLQSQEAVAFNLYVAPRPNYPALYVQPFFMPLELSWGMPNPDFLNHNGFIDGAHNYRIYGNVRGIRWATLQISRGFWGDEAQETTANVDFDDLLKDRNGNFEMFLGPSPPAGGSGKSWVRTDPRDHDTWLVLREVAYDWERDTPMEVHIEMLDRNPDAPIYPDEQELARRIDRARKYVIFNFEFALANAKRFLSAPDKVPDWGQARASNYIVNQFKANSAGRQQGGNPLGYWIGMLYDIVPDEALIIEMKPIPSRYWGFQLGSVWGQTTDYSYHQSSINSVQARLDNDGKFRAVLSLRDPGVPNWLDPAGLERGTALLRFYKSDGYVLPTVTRVKLSELRRKLPPETPNVTPQQRAAALAIRQKASLRRYGQ